MTAELALVVNPTSGKGRGARYGERAESALREAGVAVRRIVGRDAHEAAKLAQAALDAGAPALVVVGGDGMVNLGLQLVAGTGRPLGVIPAGTGNDVARYLGLPLGDPEAAARIVAAGHTGRSDLGRVTSAYSDEPRWFGTVLACGLDSKVNERANRMRRPRGPSRYTLALLAELVPFRALPFELSVDGAGEILDGMLIAVGNGPGYGGGMRICPQADPRDGRFQVTVVDRVGKLTLLRIFPGVFSGRHIRHPKVGVRHGARIELTSSAPVPVSVWADGERVGTLPATCETVPGALTAFVPAPPPEGSGDPVSRR
ncbi:MAG TPA: diacylglycerol kinase [Actinocrinis sp.]|nr:diacylglycerol kinase [Actinocrinis sp.]